MHSQLDCTAVWEGKSDGRGLQQNLLLRTAEQSSTCSSEHVGSSALQESGLSFLCNPLYGAQPSTSPVESLGTHSAGGAACCHSIPAVHAHRVASREHPDSMQSSIGHQWPDARASSPAVHPALSESPALNKKVRNPPPAAYVLSPCVSI